MDTKKSEKKKKKNIFKTNKNIEKFIEVPKKP